MNYASINPDLESLRLVVWLSGILISVLLAVVGYFLRQQGDASKALTDAVNKLRTAVEVLQMQGTLKYPVIDNSLKEHGQKIEDHENRITKIETWHEKVSRNERKRPAN